MLKPYAAETMDSYPVTPKMNNARFEDPEAVERIEREVELPFVAQ